MAKQLPFYTEPGDITVQVGAGVLIHRCGYLVVRDEKLLTLYVPDEDIYFIPGGRVNCGTCTQKTVVREVEEETGIIIKEEDTELAAIIEYFFTRERSGSKCHEIAMYYRATLAEDAVIPENELDGARFPFVWIPLKDMKDYNIKPAFLPDHLEILEGGLKHIIHYEDGFEIKHVTA